MAPTMPALRPGQLIEESPELGSPPIVYQRLMQVINHPRGAAGDVANVISQDTALTARLLKLVNSAFFAFPKKIDTVSQAVTVVGTSQVRDLALATSVVDMFQSIPGDLIDAEEFWKHSLACGVAARAIAALRNEANVERFFVAGILHDVGRLVLLLRAPDHMRAALERAKEKEILTYEAEREVLGFDHGRVGGSLMDHWSMSDALRESIRLHHEPNRAERCPVETATVHFGDILANALQIGSSGERFVPPVSPGAWNGLGFGPEKMGLVVEEVDKQYAAAVQLLGMGE